LSASFEGRTLTAIQKPRLEVRVISDDRSRHEMSRPWTEGKAIGIAPAGRHGFGGRTLEEPARNTPGNLRNVSAGGVFVETSSLPPLGTEIDIKFEFDRPRGAPTASITAKGRVTRVEMLSLDHQVTGFAVATGRMNLHRLGGDC
jgi:hypothetical protein